MKGQARCVMAREPVKTARAMRPEAKRKSRVDEAGAVPACLVNMAGERSSTFTERLLRTSVYEEVAYDWQDEQTTYR